MSNGIEFDADKDRSNIEKHGVSLALAERLELLAYVDDDRFGEPRFRLYGRVEGINYCVAGTRRGKAIRIISMRRAHAKEMRRYVGEASEV